MPADRASHSFDAVHHRATPGHNPLDNRGGDNAAGVSDKVAGVEAAAKNETADRRLSHGIELWCVVGLTDFHCPANRERNARAPSNRTARPNGAEPGEDHDCPQGVTHGVARSGRQAEPERVNDKADRDDSDRNTDPCPTSQRRPQSHDIQSYPIRASLPRHRRVPYLLAHVAHRLSAFPARVHTTARRRGTRSDASRRSRRRAARRLASDIRNDDRTRIATDRVARRRRHHDAFRRRDGRAHSPEGTLRTRGARGASDPHRASEPERQRDRDPCARKARARAKARRNSRRAAPPSVRSTDCRSRTRISSRRQASARRSAHRTTRITSRRPTR